MLKKKMSSDVLPHALEENLDALSFVLLYSCFHFPCVCLTFRYICLPEECQYQRIPLLLHNARQTFPLCEHYQCHGRDHDFKLNLTFSTRRPAKSPRHLLLCLSGP